MTRDEAAAQLNGCQYGEEGSRDLFKAMQAAGLVAVFGGSDDLVYFAGAADDELGARDGRLYHVTRQGLLTNECEDDECPYHAKIKAKAATIKAIWDRDGYSWQYETAIPHTTFEVLEDDRPYCRGLVFALADVPEA